MKAALKNIYIISLSLLTITAYADSPSIAGKYQCKRTDSANVTTSYPLTITKNADSFTFEWDDDSGNPTLQGSGVAHPNMTNLISVAFSDPKDSTKNFGVELFNIKPDGSLDANWALQSSKAIGSETCTKSKYKS